MIKLIKNYILSKVRKHLFRIMYPFFDDLKKELKLQKDETNSLEAELYKCWYLSLINNPNFKFPSKKMHMKNILPNDKGITSYDASLNAKKIITESNDINSRKFKHQSDLKGFAWEDALNWDKEYQVFSYFKLAYAICEMYKDIFKEFNKVSILELGCGSGVLRQFLFALGVECYVGVDANPLSFKESPFISDYKYCYHQLNLNQTIDFNNHFNVVCSFEVLEHIEECYIDNLLKTISLHMNNNSIFIGSISTLPLDVHLTIKPKEWWLKKFKFHNLETINEYSFYEELVSSKHPYNWDPKNSHIFILKKLN